MDKKYVIVPSKYFAANKDDLLVSVFITSMNYFINSFTKRVYVTPVSITFDIYGKIQKENVTRVKNQLLYLKKIGVVENIKGTDTFFVTIENLNNVKNDLGSFAVVEFDKVFKILETSRKNKVSLVAHYCRIISTLFYKTKEEKYAKKFGHVSIDFFMKKYKLSRNTVLRMHKALHELELISFKNPGKTGEEYSTNFYCRFEDEKLLLKFLSSKPKKELEESFEDIYDLDEYEDYLEMCRSMEEFE